jgi:hypothetical protein
MKKKINEPEEPYTGKTYFYIAIVLDVLSAVAFALTFTALGIYSLIASILLTLASLTFCNTQKKKNNLPYLKWVFIASYALLTIEVLLFIGGIIYSAL